MTVGRGLYETLGLDKTASGEDIKKAFKSLAKEYHPDKATDENTRETFEEKFKEVNHAYTILSDDVKRADYDSQGDERRRKSSFANCSSSSTQFSANFHFNCMFDLLGGGFSVNQSRGYDDTDYHMRRRGSGSNLRRKASAPVRGRRSSHAGDAFSKITTKTFETLMSKRRFQMRPVQFDIDVTLEEFFHGCVKKRKVVRKRFSKTDFSLTDESEILMIEVKPGWRDGTKLTYEGYGDEDEYHKPGDLIFNLREKEHELFKREGKSSLSYVHTISLRDALTKECHVVPTICDEGAVVVMAEGEIVTPHTVHTIIGYGMPLTRNPNERGSFYVNYEIIYPPSVSTSLKLQLASLIPDPDADSEQLGTDSCELPKEQLFSESDSSGLNFVPLLNSEDGDVENVEKNEQNFPIFEAVAEEQELTGACLEVSFTKSVIEPTSNAESNGSGEEVQKSVSLDGGVDDGQVTGNVDDEKDSYMIPSTEMNNTTAPFLTSETKASDTDELASNDFLT